VHKGGFSKCIPEKQKLRKEGTGFKDEKAKC